MTREAPQYMDTADIDTEDMAQLLSLLQDVGVSPTQLLAYALACDAVMAHAENSTEDDEMTVENIIEANHASESDDGDLVDILFYDAKLFLAKMGRL